MISDARVARLLLDELFAASGDLDHSVATALAECPTPEFEAYRRAVGQVLAEMWERLIEPILAAHPDLTPPGLRDADA